MHRRRLVFVLLALAVFGVSLGAGATIGYARAAAGGQAVDLTGTVGAVGDGAPGASAAPGLQASPTDSDTGGTGPTGSPAGPTPTPGRTPTAGWPLVAADSLGPPPGFVLQVPVLMYHRIAPADQVGRSLPGLVVPPDLFAAQLEALVAAGWHSITAAQLAVDLANGVQPSPQTFVITFDDGRRDGYTEALPILRRLGLVATFYVITARIDESSSLTASEIRRLASLGMEIGSHTMDHVRISTLNPWLAQGELNGSAARIAAVTGGRASTFAYPFGSVSPLAQSLVADAGYGLAFTEQDGCLLTWPTRFMAPRLRVSPWTSPQDLLHRMTVCTGGA